MAFGKWIGGFFGFAKGGVLGAIVGYVMGSLFDNFLEKQQQGQQEEMWGKANDNREYATPRGTDTRDDFLFSLMVLCAHMIHADGKVMHSEMENVRKFLRQNFGEAAVTDGNRILLNLFDYKKQQGTLAWQQQIRQSCAQMTLAMPEEHRIQLVAFLAEIAKADGKVQTQEIEALKQIAMLLGMGVGLVDQLLNLGGTTLEEAYKVLGISADATDEEVRKAYRKMVIQHHPDKVQNLGEDVKEAATRKLQEINKAKEMIFKARGLD